jgi:glutamyl-tRNA synthetase
VSGRTRLAPSPTGALHLGNARTFLLTWLHARANGEELVFRMEDLDGPRIKAGAAEQALEDLRWLGIDWDGEVLWQSTRAEAHDAALADLAARGLVYPCVCTRKEIERARSAPHFEDAAPAYPGTCRGRFADAGAAEAATGRQPAWRFRVPPGRQVAYEDRFRGHESAIPADGDGDVVVAKKTGEAAYQLAVVVDDAHQGVDHVIRGDDLVPSTFVQLLLYEALGLEAPTFSHLPLVRGEDGRRLAKRHGDTRIATYREAGVAPERVVGLLAHWSGLGPREARSASDLVAGGLAWERVPSEDVRFTPGDDAWLQEKG